MVRLFAGSIVPLKAAVNTIAIILRLFCIPFSSFSAIQPTIILLQVLLYRFCILFQIIFCFFVLFAQIFFSNHIKEQIKNRSGNTFYCSFCFDLVMEQSDSCKRHRHIIFVTCADYIVVTNGSSRLRNIFHTAFVSTFDIISKREERI